MDSFLEDLVTSRRQFCSSLLVNAVLAAGCQGYAKIANRTEFWNPRTLQYQFSAEARRLWDMEVDSPSLTTIQAGLIMSLTCNVNGVDKAGWSYLTLLEEGFETPEHLHPGLYSSGKVSSVFISTGLLF
ncbi:hypothetical protein HZS61_015993 [Fusarium oxysporum f. sp. conglutinans]|uniref:Xylanolytic transcriptional activator regulatory domain-containing protein n=1 Tax=Fusarium oxysporum f. sp. conglutinans TaxID=100902 RepID=A0A8H6GLB6_FUSOX|nr:hypothetical protein HZS61_015993 [Fusarium oxysporum f. sp. conglutinans]